MTMEPGSNIEMCFCNPKPAQQAAVGRKKRGECPGLNIIVPLKIECDFGCILMRSPYAPFSICLRVTILTRPLLSTLTGWGLYPTSSGSGFRGMREVRLGKRSVSSNVTPRPLTLNPKAPYEIRGVFAFEKVCCGCRVGRAYRV